MLKLTKYFESLDLLGVQGGSVGFRVQSLLDERVDLFSEGLIRFLVLEQVVEHPEADTEGVVVDVQVYQVVSLDVCLRLSLVLQEGHRRAQVVGQVLTLHQLLGARHHEHLAERLHRLGKENLRHAEPEVVEELVERVEVPVRHV